MFPDDILERNHAFTFHRKPQPLPAAEAAALAVVTCFDPRLDPLLRPALGLAADEGFFVRTAGALIEPGDRTLRALTVAVYLFEVRQVLVLGHTSCKMAAFDTNAFIDAFRRRGTAREAFDDDLRKWAGAIASPRQGVLASAAAIADAECLPRDLLVAGALLDDTTGEVRMILRPEESPSEPLAREEPGREKTPAAETAPDEAPPTPPEGLSPALETVRTAVEFLVSQPQMNDALSVLEKALHGEKDLRRQLEHVRKFVEVGAGDLAEVRDAFHAVRGELSASKPSIVRGVILPLLERARATRSKPR